MAIVPEIGPLHVVDTRTGQPPVRLLEIHTRDGEAIAHVYSTNPQHAILFAAAPEMLTVLHAAYHALESYRHGNASTELAASVAAALDDVIAKAEGRS